MNLLLITLYVCVSVWLYAKGFRCMFLIQLGYRPEFQSSIRYCFVMMKRVEIQIRETGGQ